jgi:hypothetical protein
MGWFWRMDAAGNVLILGFVEMEKCLGVWMGSISVRANA